MTYSIDQLKGSFSDALIFTIEDVEEIKLAVASADIREEIIESLSTKAEEYVIFCTHNYIDDCESTLFCLFPEAGRGGVCCGGLAEWFDATNMDDLELQYLQDKA